MYIVDSHNRQTTMFSGNKCHIGYLQLSCDCAVIVCDVQYTLFLMKLPYQACSCDELIDSAVGWSDTVCSGGELIDSAVRWSGTVCSCDGLIDSVHTFLVST